MFFVYENNPSPTSSTSAGIVKHVALFTGGFAQLVPWLPARYETGVELFCLS